MGLKAGEMRCPARGCKAPADVLNEGRWTCIEHFMGEDPRDLPRPPELLNAEEVDGANYTADHDHRPGEPFEAEADGMGPSRLPRFGRGR